MAHARFISGTMGGVISKYDYIFFPRDFLDFLIVNSIERRWLVWIPISDQSELLDLSGHISSSSYLAIVTHSTSSCLISFSSFPSLASLPSRPPLICIHLPQLPLDLFPISSFVSGRGFLLSLIILPKPATAAWSCSHPRYLFTRTNHFSLYP